MAPPGTKRPRKRGRPNKDLHDDSGVPPVKRRGRPRKKPLEHDGTQSSLTAGASSGPQSQVRSSQETIIRGNEEEIENEKLADEERDDDEQITDEEDYESEEDMIYPFDHTLSKATFGFRTSSHYTKSPLSRVFDSEGSTNIIDHLKIEMAGLRRQSAEAVSVSLRMSDQLAEAQADASRARAALKTAERMLEDEARKRRDAEREADEEARRRRAAEEALKALRVQCPSSTPALT